MHVDLRDSSGVSLSPGGSRSLGFEGFHSACGEGEIRRKKRKSKEGRKDVRAIGRWSGWGVWGFSCLCLEVRLRKYAEGSAHCIHQKRTREEINQSVSCFLVDFFLVSFLSCVCPGKEEREKEKKGRRTMRKKRERRTGDVAPRLHTFPMFLSFPLSVSLSLGYLYSARLLRPYTPPRRTYVYTSYGYTCRERDCTCLHACVCTLRPGSAIERHFPGEGCSCRREREGVSCS